MRRNPRPPADFFVLLTAAPRLLAVWVMLPAIGIGRVRRWLGTPAAKNGEAPEFDAERWRRRSIALRRIGARLPGCHCLARSIALSNWLNRAGHSNKLKIGITGTSVTLKSHAWVEKDNEILDDSRENVWKFHEISEI